MANICENCGAELKEGARFCQECGNKVETPKEKANFCPNCGNELTSGEDFCSECGIKIDSKHSMIKKSDKKILIIVAAIAVAILIAAVANGVMSQQDVELETYDFGYMTMLVPVGSHFSEYDSVGKGTDYWAIGYENSLEDSSTLYMVWIGNYDSSGGDIYDYIETDGDLDVYQFEYKGSYMIQRHIGGYYIQVAGFDDLDTLKEIANSIEVKKPITTRVN